MGKTRFKNSLGKENIRQGWSTMRSAFFNLKVFVHKSKKLSTIYSQMWISTKIEIHIYHKLSTIILIPIIIEFSNVSCETNSKLLDDYIHGLHKTDFIII